MVPVGDLEASPAELDTLAVPGSLGLSFYFSLSDVFSLRGARVAITPQTGFVVDIYKSLHMLRK
jgi:hypothetical protein